jgi:threonine aldolase
LIRNDVHQVQPAAISITNATEYGLVYRADEVAALGALAKKRRLALHMDGARIANALATTGESPADVSWRAGVDTMSFGFIKNGGLNAEALILFRTELFDEVAVRRKRAGHLSSKGRMLAAQILALLEDDLWLDNARAANAAAQRLAAAAAHRLAYPVEANEIFERSPMRPSTCAQGFDFTNGVRAKPLVTSWDQQANLSTVAAIAAL